LENLGELSQDKVGSVICKKSGLYDQPRIMLAGHMDEIGFMVKQITPEGFLKFLPLGGWFDQVLLGQRVIIQTKNGDVVGVIGARPPHLLSPEEREKVVKRKDMYIDIGRLQRKWKRPEYVSVILFTPGLILLSFQADQLTYQRHSMTEWVQPCLYPHYRNCSDKSIQIRYSG
jgi:putative aminopeptidase FrvX